MMLDTRPSPFVTGTAHPALAHSPSSMPSIDMPTLQDRPSVQCSRMEDDEVIGTVRQFSDRLGLAESQVVPCLQEAEQSIIVQAGTGPDQLLILDGDGLGVLAGCASSDTGGT
jgi:hypothetical protein